MPPSNWSPAAARTELGELLRAATAVDGFPSVAVAGYSGARLRTVRNTGSTSISCSSGMWQAMTWFG